VLPWKERTDTSRKISKKQKDRKKKRGFPGSPNSLQRDYGRFTKRREAEGKKIRWHFSNRSYRPSGSRDMRRLTRTIRLTWYIPGRCRTSAKAQNKEKKTQWWFSV